MIYSDSAIAKVNRYAFASDSLVFTDSAIANIITYANAYDGIVFSDIVTYEGEKIGVVHVSFSSSSL